MNSSRISSLKTRSGLQMTSVVLCNEASSKSVSSMMHKHGNINQKHKLPPPEHDALAPQLSRWTCEMASRHDSLPDDSLPPLPNAAATLAIASPLYCYSSHTQTAFRPLAATDRFQRTSRTCEHMFPVTSTTIALQSTVPHTLQVSHPRREVAYTPSLLRKSLLPLTLS